MEFYFIRHGQSENNLLYAETGASNGRSIDPELTELGGRQAERLAHFLNQAHPGVAVHGRDSHNLTGFGITHLYCSLMVRSVATGSIVSKILGVPLVAWVDLHEEGGIYLEDPQTGEYTGQPGKNRTYFQQHYPDLILSDSVSEEGWWNRPFEGASQRPTRARRFLHDLIERHGQTDHRVAVISHGGFYNQLLRVILDMQVTGEHNPWFLLNNAAISRIDIHERGIGVAYLNRVEFLAPEMVT